MTSEESEGPIDGGDPASSTNLYSWDALKESLRDDPELSDDLRVCTLDAIVILQALLGEEWMRQGSPAHPILSLFLNRAEWTRVRLYTLADALTTVNRLPGGAHLVARVCQGPEAASAALFEIETAVRGLALSCAIELEPATVGDKRCDLALTSVDGRRLFVEITGVAPFSNETLIQRQLLDRIYPLFKIIGSDHEGGGHLLYWPAKDERPALVAQAEVFWEEALARTERAELDIPGTLHLWCEPVRFGESLPEGEKRTLFKAPLREDPLGRTRRAVRQKLGQLPIDQPGVILVRPPQILWETPNALSEADQVVAVAVKDCPQIVAVILVRWCLSTDRQERRVRVSDTAELIQSPDRHIFVRQSLVVWNAGRSWRDVDEMVAFIA